MPQPLRKNSTEKEFLRIHKGCICDGNLNPIFLRGVTLGGWLMMEGYILHSLNIAEQFFKKKFAQKLGARALADFETDFRRSFIQKKDIQSIAELGFNCIRVPFNYRMIEKFPYKYDGEGLKYLDQVVAWAQEYHVGLILDLHAACGSQNHDWHSDSLGPALLWKKPEFRERTFRLWEFVADRYKDESSLIGYDLLNEAVLEDTKLLNRFYNQVIKTIRGVDRRHILFVEGNRWAQDLDCLDDFDDENLALSIHFYQPNDFTFNFVPHLLYPLKTRQSVWGKKDMQHSLEGYAKISKNKSRPIFVGEFGVNYREGIYGEDKWVKDALSCFKEFGFSWTYWTYKAVKNNVFPDGIFSYLGNPPWVNRAGPRFGWDTYSNLWLEKRKEIIESWKTEKFSENSSILQALLAFTKQRF